MGERDVDVIECAEVFDNLSVRVIENHQYFVLSEVFVTIGCDDGFDIRHAGVITQEHPARDGRRFDTFVTQYA